MISIREFARRDGCDEKLVRNAKRDGHLGDRSAKLLDASLVGTGWRRTKRRGLGKSADVADKLSAEPQSVRAAETRTVVPADATDDLFEAAETFIRRVLRGDYESLAEAERIKENGLALKHMLDGQRKAGNLIPRSAAEAAFFEAARDNRDAWMGWVGRIGITAAAELQVDARLFTEVMSKLVHQHLTELGEPEFEPGIDPAEG